jgi:hypothetical protein
VADQHLDELFARFRAGPPLAAPAGAGAARHAFRRRRRSQTAAAGVLAAVAVGLPSVGFAAGVFDHSPSVSGSPSPRTARPDDVTGPGASLPITAMLRESDLPAGYRLVPLSEIGAYRTLSENAGDCAGPPSTGIDARGNVRRLAAYQRGPDEGLYQVIDRMDSAAAAQDWLDGLPDRLRRHCGQLRFTVADTDFAGAGAGSILIRVTPDTGESNLYLFVRQGPLITQIWQQHQTDAGALREVGRVAAERLCEGTSTC